MGPKWKEVIKLLPNRTENMLKNRFYSYLKKKYFPKNALDIGTQLEFNNKHYSTLENQSQMPEIDCINIGEPANYHNSTEFP